MTFDQRKVAALDLLEKTGMKRANYNPPFTRLLWRFNLHVPPAHFLGFVPDALLFGLIFGLSWGAIMWPLIWSRSGMSPIRAATIVLIAGAAFSLMTASYHAWGRWKHRLPGWRDVTPTE